MNTKIVMQRLAKAASSKAKASFAFIKTYSGGLHSIELGSDRGFVRLRLRHRDKGASCRIQRLPLSSDAKSDTFAGIDLKAFRFGDGMSNRLISSERLSAGRGGHTDPHLREYSPMNCSNEAHHIVVIGRGADGFVLAARLGHKLGRNGKALVTFVDQSMSTRWSPFLYEVEGGVFNEGAGMRLAPGRKQCTLFNSGLGYRRYRQGEKGNHAGRGSG